MAEYYTPTEKENKILDIPSQLAIGDTKGLILGSHYPVPYLLDYDSGYAEVWFQDRRVTTISLSNNEEIIFLGGNQGAFYNWRTHNFCQAMIEPYSFRPTIKPVFSKDDSRLLYFAAKSCIWDVQKNEKIFNLPVQHNEIINGGVFCEDNNVIITITSSNSIFIIDSRSGELENCIESLHSENTLKSVAITSSHDIFTLGNNLKQWDIRNLQSILSIPTMNCIKLLQYSHYHKLIEIGDEYSQVRDLAEENIPVIWKKDSKVGFSPLGDTAVMFYDGNWKRYRCTESCNKGNEK